MLQLDHNIIAETTNLQVEINKQAESKTGNIASQAKDIKEIKTKSNNILADVTNMTELQKDLFNANDGDDE